MVPPNDGCLLRVYELHSTCFWVKLKYTGLSISTAFACAENLMLRSFGTKKKLKLKNSYI